MKGEEILRRSTLLVALMSSSAAVWPAMALAQTQPGQQQAGAGIAEIVVTASRRTENIQKAALSIYAVSSEALARANVAKQEDLNGLVPGVIASEANGMPLVYIRGVGNTGTQTFFDPAVATNMDGVYITRAWATRALFYDLERVEVLRGPQGTLYGRNASGGAINMISAKPKLGEYSGFAELQAGNYALKEGTAAVNVPLNDTLALRAAGQVVDRDGYLTDGTDDQKSEAARLHLLWKPDENLSLLFSASYQHLHGRGPGYAPYPQIPGDPFAGIGNPAVTAIVRAQPGTGALLRAPSAITPFVNQIVRSVGAELNWNFGFATLTVLPSYWDARFRQLTSTIGIDISNNVLDRTTSVEARLSNNSGKLKWVAGGYFSSEDQDSLSGDPTQGTYQGTSSATTGPYVSNTRSYAAFGQATYDLTDRLRLTGGLRYTYERKFLDSGYLSHSRPTAGACAPPRVPAPAPVGQPGLTCQVGFQFGGVLTYNNVTYKAGLEYDLTPTSMAYANVSTGFKSGGFYNAPPPNTFRPEKLTAFQAGLKNRFLDNRLQVNTEAFYYRYNDKQEGHISPNSIGTLTFITENAGRAKSYGIDLDVLFQPTSADDLSFKIQYNKTSYSYFLYSYPSASAGGAPLVNCAVGPLASGAQTVDCSGHALLRAPLWSGSAGYGHTFDLGTAGSLSARGEVSFSSAYEMDILFLPQERQPAFALVNLDLSYRPVESRWEISAYVHNIGNEAVLTSLSRWNNLTSANPLLPVPNGLFAGPLRPPRTFGGRVHFAF